LIKKGYIPEGAVEISMPNNIVNKSGKMSDERFQKAFIRAEEFARGILARNVTWAELFRGSAFVSFLTRNTVLPWISMRMLFKLETDESKCTRCGLCVKECPVQNILLTDLPLHLGKCEFCMHCGAVCPNGAIRIKGKPDLYIRHEDSSRMTTEYRGNPS
jgi:ferredoxin